MNDQYGPGRGNGTGPYEDDDLFASQNTFRQGWGSNNPRIAPSLPPVSVFAPAPKRARLANHSFVALQQHLLEVQLDLIQ